jgi:hypothetical protein
LAIAEENIGIAVMVQVILENALQNALLRYVQVLTAVSKGTLGKTLKAFGNPFHNDSPNIMLKFCQSTGKQ